jgi:hypothetical protein
MGLFRFTKFVALFIAFFPFIDTMKKLEQLSTGPSAGFEVGKTRGVRTKSCKGLQSGLPERLPLCDSLLRHFFYSNIHPEHL